MICMPLRSSSAEIWLSLFASRIRKTTCRGIDDRLVKFRLAHRPVLVGVGGVECRLDRGTAGVEHDLIDLGGVKLAVGVLVRLEEQALDTRLNGLAEFDAQRCYGRGSNRACS